MGRAALILIIALICALEILDSTVTHAAGTFYRTNCDRVVTGGSYYQILNQSDDGRTITLHQINSGKKTQVVAEDRSFQHIQLSTTCRRIAYQKYDTEAKAMALHLVLSSGEKERVFPDVYRYAFGGVNDGCDWLSYIAGLPQEGFPGFQSAGTWVVNLDTREALQIVENGYDLAWAEFDQSFYVLDGRSGGEPGTQVLRFNLNTKKLEETPYHGIDFSLGGKYYYTRVYDGDEFRVFLRATNEDITKSVRNQMERVRHRSPRCWLSDTKVLFSSYKPMRIHCKIVDFSTAETWEVQEEVIGYSVEDGATLMLLIDGNVVVRNFEDVATRIYPKLESEK